MPKAYNTFSWLKLLRNLRYGVFTGCLIFAFTVWNVLKFYSNPPSSLYFSEIAVSNWSKPETIDAKEPHEPQPSIGNGSRPLSIESAEPQNPPQSKPFRIESLHIESREPHETRQPNVQMKGLEPFCNLSHPRSDVCNLNGDVRIHGNSSTVFVASTSYGKMFKRNASWHIKPYARKGDEIAMRNVRTMTIKAIQNLGSIPRCSRKYTVPAIVFSTAGYTRNYFHGFTDVLIPLFSTSMEFNREVRFLITDKETSWLAKFKHLLKKLSRYELIDIDNQTDQVLCLPSMIIGLEANEEFRVDTSKSRYFMTDFTELLRNTYNLKRTSVMIVKRKKPRLLMISRRTTRKVVNEEQIASMAKRLGFRVIINETGTDVKKVAKFINSFDVIVGVQGAGLSNMVFLPENAVVIQIVPFGITKLLARLDFKAAAEDMKLIYLDYKINPKESSLIQEHTYDHKIFKDHISVFGEDWLPYKETYLNKQDMKLDLVRFRNTLSKARKLLQT